MKRARFSPRLTQAEVWPKYGFYSTDTFNNSDQRIHCDFPNHTLVCPPRWKEPEAVEMIIYLNDVEQCGGATAIVPRTGSEDPAYTYPMTNMPGFGATQWRNNKEKAEGWWFCTAYIIPTFLLLIHDSILSQQNTSRGKTGKCMNFVKSTYILVKNM